MSNFCTDEARMKITRCATRSPSCARSSRRISSRGAASREKSHRERWRFLVIAGDKVW